MANFFGARKDSGMKIISMVPSVNKTQVGSSVVPVPYPVMIDLTNKNNFSANVNFNGNEACRFNSDSSKVSGDEAGKIGGVKSGTVSAKAEPKDKSKTVRVNKQYLIRCNDMFWMNNQNTIGRLICPPPAPIATITDDGLVELPEEDHSWLDNLWDKAKEIEQDLDEGLEKLDKINQKYAVVTRIEGGAQLAFGCVETVGGVIGIIAPEPATTVGGVLLAANGVDGAQAGLRQLITGETTNTIVDSGVNFAATAAGVDPNQAQMLMAVGSLLSGNPATMEKNAMNVAEMAVKEEKLLSKGEDLADASRAIKQESRIADEAGEVSDAAKASRREEQAAAGGNGNKDNGSGGNGNKGGDGSGENGGNGGGDGGNNGKKKPKENKKKDEDDGGKVKGKEKSITKRKGDCAEYLVEKYMKEELGYEHLKIGEEKASEVLTNGSGHGIDHMMTNKAGELVIGETKADKSTLGKLQKMGGLDDLIHQHEKWRLGLEGEGAFKYLAEFSKEKRTAIKKTLDEISDYIDMEDIKPELYRAKLNKNKNTKYYPVTDEEQCKEYEMVMENWLPWDQIKAARKAARAKK